MSALPAVAFSEFVMHPSQAAAVLERERGLRLRRRNAQDLVVTTDERAEREEEVIDFSSRLLAELLHDQAGGPGVVRRVLPRALPWIRFLPDGSADEIASQLVGVAEAATAISNVMPVAQVLTEWRHTAEIYADPQLYALVAAPITDAGPVVVPDGRP